MGTGKNGNTGKSRNSNSDSDLSKYRDKEFDWRYDKQDKSIANWDNAQLNTNKSNYDLAEDGFLEWRDAADDLNRYEEKMLSKYEDYSEEWWKARERLERTDQHYIELQKITQELYNQYREKHEYLQNTYTPEQLKELTMNYHENCQRCVWAFEMRMRGYDVVAKPFLGDNIDQIFGENGGSDSTHWKHISDDIQWLRPSYDRQPNGKYGYPTNLKFAETVIKNSPANSRFFVTNVWKSGSGHVWMAIHEGKGQIRWIDPQNGKSGKYVKNYLSSSLTFKGFTSVARVDNVTIDSDRIDIAVQRRKPKNGKK